MKIETLERALHDAMSVDERAEFARRVAAWLSEKKPATSGLTLDREMLWWRQKLIDGRVLPGDDGWCREVRMGAIADDYIANLGLQARSRRGGETACGTFLQRIFGRVQIVRRVVEFERPLGDGTTRTARDRARIYILPPLDEARAIWAETHGEEPWG